MLRCSKVEELCEMLDDYQISLDRDLPKPCWDFMRKKGFLGMMIPREYGEDSNSVSSLCLANPMVMQQPQ